MLFPKLSCYPVCLDLKIEHLHVHTYQTINEIIVVILSQIVVKKYYIADFPLTLTSFEGVKNPTT